MRFLLSVCIFLSSAFASQAFGYESVTLAMSKSIPPYVVAETQSGIQLERIKQAFASQGIKVEQLIFTSNLRAERLAQEGKVDGVINASPSSALQLSEPVLFYHNVAISRRNDRLQIDQVSDLANYSVMAFQNANKYLGADFAKMADRNPRYDEVVNQQAQIARLFAGQIQVIVLDKRIFAHLAQAYEQQGGRSPVTIRHELFPPAARGVGFSDPKLLEIFNRGLATLPALAAP